MSANAYPAYVFDLYGTLVDIGSLEGRVAESFGARAREALDLWRAKQIAYSFASSLMGRYEPFDVLTGRALAYAAARFGMVLAPAEGAALVAAWTELPVYKDVSPTLAALRERGATLAVLSNGVPAALESTLRAAGVRDAFAHVLSVDAVETYKPAPAVYALAETALGLPRAEIGFVSSNGWDATGAAAFGFSALWCNRAGLPAETLGPPPTRTFARLDELLGEG